MGDLYSDDITSEQRYPAAAVLHDIRALIATGQREGPLLDYKADISPKDSWPETIAAFANTFGGIIIFGVEGQGDQPRRLIGYDPKGVEMKTRLGSTLLSRIQPRPNIQIRVLTLDTDAGKEVALVRVAEGTHPPYLYNKGDEHRVYLRSGAQKVEADYLQLSALLEKRVHPSPPISLPVADLHQRLRVNDPADKTKPSEAWYRFIMTPESHGAARRLTAAVEDEFEECFHRFTGGFVQPPSAREQHVTTYRLRKDSGNDLVLALTSDGAIGYATHAVTNTNDGPFFSPFEFCEDLISILGITTMYSCRARYFGEHRLSANILIPEAQMLRPGSFRGRFVTGALFEPSLASIRVNMGTEMRVTLHPAPAEPIRQTLASITNDLARAAGTLLSPTFDQFATAFINDALQTVGHP
ncbi:MAG: ATP-binding protein [Acidobacteria bacterium]|nr:ATP-binding protein [Acidobacteriota bacterium]